MSSLMAVMQARAVSHPDHVALICASPHSPTIEFSWSALRDSVAGLAAFLRETGIHAGDVVAILARKPAEQSLGLLGALGAGAVPTVLSYPSPKQNQSAFFSMFCSVIQSSGARWLLCATDFFDRAKEALHSIGSECVCVALPDSRLTGGFTPADLATSADGPMFLQFSSGTMGARKGVAISHEMLRQHSQSFAKSIALEPNDKIVSWAPLYHDGGLVRCFLSALSVGAVPVLLDPFEWLQNPAFLFRVIQDYSVDYCYQPNFAYSYCAMRIRDEEITGVDLSHVRAFLFGAEPARLRTFDEFVQRFADHGVRRAQLQVAYGMAENTCGVSQTRLGEEVRFERLDRGMFGQHNRAEVTAGRSGDDVVVVASCGYPLEGVSVRIRGTSVDRVVGEIEVKSDFQIREYLSVPGSTWPSPLTDDGWLRTEDLGYLVAGELFVCGRSKDLMIINGANVFPADVEEVVQGVAGCKPGRVVAFGVDNDALGTESIVICAERVDDRIDPLQLRNEISRVIDARMGISASDISICGPGTLRKSTSGKLSRPENRRLYLEGRLRSLHRRDTPTDDHRTVKPGSADYESVRDCLLAIWSEVLGIEVHEDQDLFVDLGADSIAAVRAAGAINEVIDSRVSQEQILACASVREQSERILEGIARDSYITVVGKGRPRTPLVLVHPASGHGWIYLRLLKYIQDRPLILIGSPALSDGEMLFDSVEATAKHYIRGLKALNVSGPYLLGGYSFGGAVAFEMGARLIESGDEVLAVAMFDSGLVASRATAARKRLSYALANWASRHPKVGKRIPIINRVFDIRDIAVRLNVALRPRHCHTVRDLVPLIRFLLPDVAIPQEVRRRSVADFCDWALPLVIERFSSSESRMFMPGSGLNLLHQARVRANNMRLVQRYARRTRTSCRVLYFQVSEDDRAERWARLCDVPPQVEKFTARRDGTRLTHLTMFTSENIEVFGPRLRAALDALDRAEDG
ncbi:MAG: AMP-binding protein [Gammaproteobacteria bacterium]|nr:AMP-binding protein [Gammaproteobacteria bacterium]